MRKYNIFTGRNQYDTNWQNIALSWYGLRKMLLAEPKRLNKKQGPGFVGGKFKTDGQRTQDNLENRSLLTIDLDHVPANFEPRSYLDKAKLQAVAYTTASHKPQSPRWRVIIPLNRDVDGPTYKALYAAATAKIFPGIEIDPVGGEPNQFMFYGFTLKESPYDSFESKGEQLDVDDYADEIQAMLSAADQAHSNNSLKHAHDEGGYKGLFNRSMDTILNTLDEYSTPLHISGHEVRIDGYNRKAGDYYPGDEHIYIRKTDADIVLETGRQSFDAFGIVCFYCFNNDPAAMAEHVKKVYGKAPSAIKKNPFPDMKEFDDVLPPTTMVTDNNDKATTEAKQQRTRITFESVLEHIAGKYSLSYKLVSPFHYTEFVGKNKKQLIPVNMAKLIISAFNVRRKNNIPWMYNPSRGLYEPLTTYDDKLYLIVGECFTTVTEAELKQTYKFMTAAAPELGKPKRGAKLVKNGVLLFNSKGQLRKFADFSPRYNLTNGTNQIYDPTVTNHKATDIAFKGWSNGSPERLQTLWETAAVCSGLIRPKQSGFYVKGKPGSGKSTLAAMIENEVGRENIAKVTLRQFANNDRELHQIIGKTLILQTENTKEHVSNKAIANIKALISAESITDRILYTQIMAEIDMRNANFLQISNFDLKTSSTDQALEDRLQVIEMDKRYRFDSEENADLIDELNTQEGISYRLNRYIELLPQLINNYPLCLTQNVTLTEAKKTMFVQSNRIIEWWNEDGLPSFKELRELGTKRLPVDFVYGLFLDYYNGRSDLDETAFHIELSALASKDGYTKTTGRENRARLNENEKNAILKFMYQRARDAGHEAEDPDNENALLAYNVVGIGCFAYDSYKPVKFGYKHLYLAENEI